IALLAVAIAAVVVFPFTNSNASRSPSTKVVPTDKFSRARPLPNYDIRLVNKGEFTDYDLNSATGKQSAAQNLAALARSSAVDRFRSKLSPEEATKLRAIVNETGGMKNLFIDGATLSEARSDTADNVARGFLNRNEQLFALRTADEASLKLINDD